MLPNIFLNNSMQNLYYSMHLESLDSIELALLQLSKVNYLIILPIYKYASNASENLPKLINAPPLLFHAFVKFGFNWIALLQLNKVN